MVWPTASPSTRKSGVFDGSMATTSRPLPKRRRHFRADEPHAHDDDSAAGNHLFPDAIGVLDRAETVNAFKIGTGNGDAPFTPARGNQQRFERHLTVILELHDAG
jgi:hypothetical protein